MRTFFLAAMLLIFGAPAHALGLNPFLPVSVTCPGEDKVLTVIFAGSKDMRMRVRAAFDPGLQGVDVEMTSSSGEFVLVDSMSALQAETPSDRMSYMLRGYLIATHMQACKASDEARRLFQKMIEANKAEVGKL
ncbi:hypothetical protein LJR030_004943 [Rhizobium sp. LjRoot30]|uniref:hypothetical protein n=1 Tax=Rhizobium sp. LjRoot30 TaxID=3342320 RepID=UPI003ECF46A7